MKRLNTAWNTAIIGVALLVITVAIMQLEQARDGVTMSTFYVDSTPVTRYASAGNNEAPLVVVAHGFAGSRQLMQAVSLHLARAGYVVLAFDFLGHGRNPLAMSGDVTAVDGTTQLLIDETLRVVDAGQTLAETDGRVALLGHSMATDIIVRAAALRPDINTVVAISLFSGAITAGQPQRLLAVNGAWEPQLRAVTLEALRLVDASAEEGTTVSRGDVSRRAVAAAHTEHVGVLYSDVTRREALDWLNSAFGRDLQPALRNTGYAILALLVGIVFLFYPVSQQLQSRLPATPNREGAHWWLAIAIPALVTPLMLAPWYRPFLPVLVADYLTLHLAIYGGLQLALLRWRPSQSPGIAAAPIALLLLWGICLFGFALDRYAASFWPTGTRLLLIPALACGTVPFMLADALVTGSGRGVWWQRIAARLAMLLSLALAAFMQPDELGFLLLVFPVIALFYLVHGLMGRWLARAAGPLNAGIGLGLALAWSLGVSFPLFAS